MTAAGLQEILLREVPDHLLTGVRAGEFRVYGSIVRSLGTGRIVGHLQETSGLANAASRLMGLPLPGLSSAVEVIGQGISIVQNEQIKAAVHIVQQLQIANVVIGAVGVGVSAIGFAVMAKKIDGIRADIEAVGSKLDQIARHTEAIRRDRIADDFTRLRTAAEQMEEGWLLSDPAPQWRHVASEAHAVANTFERRVRELLSSECDVDTVDPFLDAFAIAVATRVSARMAAGDDVVARNAAEEGARKLSSMGERLQLSEAALKQVADKGVEPATADWSQQLEAAVDALRPSFIAVRRRESAATATALTIAELERQGLSGRLWLDTARSEVASPLVCLLSAARN